MQKFFNLSKPKLNIGDYVSKGITPKSLLKKTSKNNNFDDITIDDLNEDSKNYEMLKSFLDSISSCQLSDAYNNVARRSGVVEGLKSINNQKVYGKITTCDTNSDDWGTITLAIDAAEKGDVLFIKSSDTDKAIWGELASTGAKAQGIVSTAVYGSVRDLDALLYMDYPVFACDFRPNAGKALGLGKVNSELDIDGIKINPGDFFFGDETGVVVIPSSLFKDVLSEVLAIKNMESNIIEMLNNGSTLSEITNLK